MVNPSAPEPAAGWLLIESPVLRPAIGCLLALASCGPANAVVAPVAQSVTIAQYTFDIRLPEGWTLEFLAPLDAPRIIHVVGDQLLIGSHAGKVYRLEPPYTTPDVLASLAGYPHSVVVDDGRLYIARTDGVDALPWTSDLGPLEPGDLEPVVSLPGGRGHDSRTLKRGPDGELYVSLGIAGNCSDQYLGAAYPADDRRGGVFRIDRSTDKARLVPYASGLRNPVGFDWHPESAALHASNNGPDHLGYSVPPEVIARLDEGSFHGMPWFQFDGDELFRDDCIRSEPPRPMTAVSLPVATLPARSAPMDLMFVGEELAAAGLSGHALLAVHGSWATDDGGGSGDPATRREPRIALIEFEDGAAITVHDFLTGFQLADGARWARPVGLATGADGAIYFTSDAGIQGLFRLRHDP